jgi:hypothetical protein
MRGLASFFRRVKSRARALARYWSTQRRYARWIAFGKKSDALFRQTLHTDPPITTRGAVEFPSVGIDLETPLIFLSRSEKRTLYIGLLLIAALAASGLIIILSFT